MIGKSIPGVRHYTYRIDPQLGDGGPGRQRHIHIFYDSDQLFAMNFDSTAHDGYHNVRIPDSIVHFLKEKGATIPDGNIIQLKCFNNSGELIRENSSPDRIIFATTKAISRIRRITIFESNVESYQAIWQAKMKYNYQHINKLTDIPQDRISEIECALVGFLEITGKYRDDVNDILDDTDNLRSLYVA